jgi:hypothetical protein
VDFKTIKEAWLEIDLGEVTTLGGLEVYWGKRAAGVYGFESSLSLLLIPGVQRLTIFGENDKSGANMSACIDCKAAWSGQAHVTRIRPDESCSDLNDVWLALPRTTEEDRAATFLGICNRLWPGASIASSPEDSCVLDEIRRIGFKAFGVLE